MTGSTNKTKFELKNVSRLLVIVFFSVRFKLELSYCTEMKEGVGLIPAKEHANFFRVSPSYH